MVTSKLTKSTGCCNMSFTLAYTCTKLSQHRNMGNFSNGDKHHSGCFSLPKEEPLSTCLPQLPVSRNVTPGRSNILEPLSTCLPQLPVSRNVTPGRSNILD